MTRLSSLARNGCVSYHPPTTLTEVEAISRLDRVLNFHRRNLRTWTLIAWGLVFLCLYDGAGYVVGGNAVAAGPSLEFLRMFLPGGMRVYGAIELILAIVMMLTMTRRPKAARWAMIAVFTYSILFSTAVIWGWHVSGEVTWGGPSKWFFAGWIALVLAARTDESGSTARNED